MPTCKLCYHVVVIRSCRMKCCGAEFHPKCLNYYANVQKDPFCPVCENAFGDEGLATIRVVAAIRDDGEAEVIFLDDDDDQEEAEVIFLDDDDDQEEAEVIFLDDDDDQEDVIFLDDDDDQEGEATIPDDEEWIPVTCKQCQGTVSRTHPSNRSNNPTCETEMLQNATMRLLVEGWMHVRNSALLFNREFPPEVLDYIAKASNHQCSEIWTDPNDNSGCAAWPIDRVVAFIWPLRPVDPILTSLLVSMYSKWHTCSAHCDVFPCLERQWRHDYIETLITLGESSIPSIEFPPEDPQTEVEPP